MIKNVDRTHHFTFKGIVGVYQPSKDVVVFGRTVKELITNLKTFMLTLNPKDEEHKKWLKQILSYFKENNIAYPCNT